jgi:hypothetical protein
MTTNFPVSKDTLTNPGARDSLSSPSHSQQHANANDAIEALQTKVGIDGSEDINSLDYKISTLESQVNEIGNTTTTTETLFGLEGNNDLTVSGIEMKTVVDYFSKTVYRTVRYVIQISRGQLFKTFQMDVLQDGTNFYVQEIEVSSNTEESLATLTLEENNGIINLCVTPVSTEVTARYYRTALKI